MSPGAVAVTAASATGFFVAESMTVPVMTEEFWA
jgi:hypothetical protein